jgi:hypothetical protein
LLEENENWRQKVLKAAKKIDPKCLEQLDKSLIYSPRIETRDSRSGTLTCRYQFDFGDRSFKMAYVDGPTNRVQASKEWISDGFDLYNLLPNSDVTFMHKTPKFVVIDGRRSSIKYFLESDSFGRYSIILSSKYRNLHNNFGRKYSYHTVLSRY